MQLRVEAAQPRDVAGRLVGLGEHEHPFDLHLGDSDLTTKLLA